MDNKIYVLGILMGVILGTWIHSWLYCLLIANLSLAFIIFEMWLDMEGLK